MTADSWITLPRIEGSITQYWVIGDPDHTYSYRMHGVDFSGNSENYPVEAETTTAVPEADVICSAPDSYDSSANDNTPADASMIFANETGQFHNFCTPLRSDYQNDEDWTKLLVTHDQIGRAS